jgi:hypothetical protein
VCCNLLYSFPSKLSVSLRTAHNCCSPAGHVEDVVPYATLLNTSSAWELDFFFTLTAQMADNKVTVVDNQVRSGAVETSVVPALLDVTLDKVPTYLQMGELFLHLKQNENTDAEDDEVFQVPVNCLKPDASVNCNLELRWLLCTLRYWIIDELPDSAYDYIMKELRLPSLELLDIASNFTAVSTVLSLKAFSYGYGFLVAAAHLGDARLMTYLRSRNHACRECNETASAGNLACLEYAPLYKYFSAMTTDCTCRRAFGNGHVECLQYAHEHGCCIMTSLQTRDCEHTTAACLRYVLDRPVRFRDAIRSSLSAIGCAAARLGSVSCVKKALGQGWKMIDEPDLFKTALLSHGTRMAEFVLRKGCMLTGREANEIVQHGGADNLMILLDRGQHLTVSSVRELGQMKEFSILREIIKRRACTATAAATTIAGIEPLQANALIGVFQKAFQNAPDLCTSAAAVGNLRLLRRAVESGCLCNSKACVKAAVGGHLSCLQYLIELGLAVTTELVRTAASGGHLDCLRYLHEQRGCGLVTKLATLALRADSVPCVTYLHEHGCALSSAAGAQYAAEAGALQCFVYYHNLAGPLETRALAWRTVWEAARNSRNSAIREFTRRQNRR